MLPTWCSTPKVNDMKICMASPYDVTDPLSWSGTPLSVYRTMSCQPGVEVTPLNLSAFHTPQNERANLLRHLDVKQLLKTRAPASRLGPAAMNPLNSRILNEQVSAGDYDALFEFGGFRQLGDLPPYFVYTDASHDLTLDFYEKNGVLPYPSRGRTVEEYRRAADYVGEIYRQAAGVLCMSGWLAECMVRRTGVSRDKVHVVYAGANWHGVTLPKNIPSKEIGDKKTIHLLLVGVDFGLKGVELVMDAVKALNRQSDRTYIFHVCGIREDFEHDEHVISHGFISKQELIGFLQSCDLFVLPSHYDCFGISFVEAMTFGLPCVGRARCAMPEIIDEGENGELVRSSDPAELAEKIGRICESPALYAAYSRSAQQKAAQFTWEKTVDRMMEAMKRALPAAGS